MVRGWDIQTTTPLRTRVQRTSSKARLPLSHEATSFVHGPLCASFPASSSVECFRFAFLQRFLRLSPVASPLDMADAYLGGFLYIIVGFPSLSFSDYTYHHHHHPVLTYSHPQTIGHLQGDDVYLQQPEGAKERVAGGGRGVHCASINARRDPREDTSLSRC